MDLITKTFWLISAPKTREDTFNTLNKKTSEENDFSTNYKFQVPDLKVGTLDLLMSLSDELQKVDTFVEQSTRKIAQQLTDALVDPNEPQKKESKNPKLEPLTVNNNNVDTYLTFFRWDEAKFPTNQSLKLLVDSIHAQVGKIDSELKTKSSEFNTVNYAISAEERKVGGNLLARDLSDVVKQTHVLESENLVSLFVCVSRFSEKEFLASYEKLTDFVLPRSAMLVEQDTEYFLYRVVLFRRVADDFKNLAKEKKYIVRDFVYDANKSSIQDKKRLEKDRDNIRKTLIRWCKTNFAEAFIAWIHLKAIRAFVESVLRYGLPTNFQAMLLLPRKGKGPKLRKALVELYGHLSSHVSAGHEHEDASNAAAMYFEDDNFFPYVSLEINLDFTQKI